MFNYLVPLFLGKGKAETDNKENDRESRSQHEGQKGVEERMKEKRKYLVDNLIIEL